MEMFVFQKQKKQSVCEGKNTIPPRHLTAYNTSGNAKGSGFQASYICTSNDSKRRKANTMQF